MTTPDPVRDLLDQAKALRAHQLSIAPAQWYQLQAAIAQASQALDADECVTELSQYQARRRLIECDYPEPACDGCDQPRSRCKCGRAA